MSPPPANDWTFPASVNSAIYSAISIVALSKGVTSNTPGGPFQKTVLDDLSKLGMNALVQELLSAKQKYVEELRLFMDKNKKLGFDIEL